MIPHQDNVLELLAKNANSSPNSIFGEPYPLASANTSPQTDLATEKDEVSNELKIMLTDPFMNYYHQRRLCRIS